MQPAPRSHPPTDRVRLFFALWPEDDVRAALAAAAQAAQAQCGGRATPADRIHATLFFIGSIARGKLDAMREIGEAVSGRAFELLFDRVRYWRHNRIVYAAARDCPAALEELVSTLRAALSRAGIEGEDRPYVPHVTLVRDAPRAPRGDLIEPRAWRVRDFVLVQSVPAGGGVRYEGVAAWPLG